MSDIFISYSRKDSEHAFLLVERLRNEGLAVWIDRDGIEAATTWSKEIAVALDECTVFVILLSAASIDSANVAKELSAAVELRKPIVPVELEPVDLRFEYLYHLSGLHRVGIENTDALLRAIAKPQSRADMPPPPRQTQTTQATGAAPSRRGGNLSRNQQLLAGLVLTALALGYYFLFQRHTGESERTSIIVLPFRDESQLKDQAHIAQGFGDELQKALFQLDGITLISKGTAQEYQKAPAAVGGGLSPFDIGKDLGVRYIITGSVLKVGDSLFVRVEVDDSRKHQATAKLTYGGLLKDIFDIQDKLAGDIAQTIRIRPTDPESFGRMLGGTKNPEAYEYYLKAQNLSWLEKSSSRAAQEYLDSALSLDSTFALAWACSAAAETEGSLEIGGFAEARGRAVRCATKAIALCPTLPEGYKCLAEAYVFARMHALPGPGTDSILRLAEIVKRLAPNDANSYLNYTFTIRWINTTNPELIDHAFAAADKAIQMNPIDFAGYGEMAFLCLQFKRPERMSAYAAHALEAAARELRLDPSAIINKVHYAYMLWACGKPKEALRLVDSLAKLYPENAALGNCACLAYNRYGLFDKSVGVIQDARRASDAGGFAGLIDWIGADVIDTLLKLPKCRDRVVAALQGYPRLGKLYFDSHEYALAASELEAELTKTEPVPASGGGGEGIERFEKLSTLFGAYGQLGWTQKRKYCALKTLELAAKLDGLKVAPIQSRSWLPLLEIVAGKTLESVAGKTMEARSSIDQLASTELDDGGAYYNLAAAQCLLGAKGPALALLASALSHDFQDYERLSRDPDFLALHSDPGYPKLLSELRPRRK